MSLRPQSLMAISISAIANEGIRLAIIAAVTRRPFFAFDYLYRFAYQINAARS